MRSEHSDGKSAALGSPLCLHRQKHWLRLLDGCWCVLGLVQHVTYVHVHTQVVETVRINRLTQLDWLRLNQSIQSYLKMRLTDSTRLLFLFLVKRRCHYVRIKTSRINQLPKMQVSRLDLTTSCVPMLCTMYSTD